MLYPFRVSGWWKRNPRNPWLGKSRAKREADLEAIGDIGTMSDGLAEQYGFWRLVTEKGIAPSELDTWSLEDIDKANAMLDMASDWQSAYQEMLEDRCKQPTES